MRTKLLIVALIGLALVIVSFLVLLPKQVSKEDQLREFYRTTDFVNIGYVETDVDDNRVWHLLKDKDIHYCITGRLGIESIAAAVADAPRAIALIKEDAKKHGYKFVEMRSEPFKLDID